VAETPKTERAPFHERSRAASFSAMQGSKIPMPHFPNGPGPFSSSQFIYPFCHPLHLTRDVVLTDDLFLFKIYVLGYNDRGGYGGGSSGGGGGYDRY